MRVLTSPAETGAVTIAFPQDVQAEAFDFPEKFFGKKVWVIPRNRCDQDLLKRAAEWIRAAQKPLIVAGGGVLYSQASEALAQFAHATGIPVCETQAGKGSLPFDHRQQRFGAVGTTGTPGANIVAREADLILGIGTRYSDFTSASKTAFQNPAVRFININVAECDAYKHAALPLTGDARLTITELQQALGKFSVEESFRAQINDFRARWENEVDRIYGIHEPPPITQGEVIGIVNNFTKPSDIVICAAGSLPGDLHKLWRTRQPGGYHMEYGFSCMGYEIAGGLGAKMADPGREVYVLVGDGSYLMLAQEIVTSIQEGYKINIVLLDNHGFSSNDGTQPLPAAREAWALNYRYRRSDKYGKHLSATRSRWSMRELPPASAHGSRARKPQTN